MKKRLLKSFGRHMTRPAIYMTFTRFLLALAAALLIDHFVYNPSGLPIRSYAFLFLAVFFAALGWIAYLRFDGIKLPRLLMKRVNIRKKPTRTYGDMSDYTDEPVISFDDLEDDEKDICCLAADMFCCAAFLLLSLI